MDKPMRRRRTKSKKRNTVKRRNMTHLGHIVSTPKAGFHSSKSGKKGYTRKPKHRKDQDHCEGEHHDHHFDD
tara:strand:- start:4989 stop:5204 length:216 start_codon:yes stop_codon:yes gene_type:complete